MAEVGVHEAKTQFSKLLRRVELGEEIVITRNKQVVAKLSPPDDVPIRRFGTGAGQIIVHGDFDEPLPDELFDALR